MSRVQGLLIPAVALLFAACASNPYDYSNFRKFSPKSILVLPPLNRSTDVIGSYSCLSTVTKPLAEQGYYVFPVEVIDRMLKENGLPTPGEMHQASLKKIAQIINPDAVLYLTLERYGSKYSVVDSNTMVELSGKLVHTKTGTVLWEGRAAGNQSSNGGGQGGLLATMVSAAVAQAVNSSTDRAHEVCEAVAAQLVLTPNHGFLPGPYLPSSK